MSRLKLLFFLLLLGCQSREVSPQFSGQEYFPVKYGSYWVYDVTETNISQLGGQTNTSYQLKVLVTDSIISSGTVTHILERFKRMDATSPWISLDTWSIRKSQFQVVVQEGNVPFIKLAFPLADGKSWNGNALNSLGGPDKCNGGSTGCDIYSVTALGKRFEGAVNYDNTVTIIENNNTDRIVRSDIRKTVYGKSVGLIYREASVLEYCTVGTCIGQQIVENGTIFKQTIKEYASH